jgi:hypothetical protein
MANGKTGRSVSVKTWQARWDAFDALPREVKAACWDAMDRWDSKGVVEALGTGRATFGARDPVGARGYAVRQILRWDQHVLGERQTWLQRNQRRVGLRREQMPPSPHQQAEATMLRSHAEEYRHFAGRSPLP